MFRNIPTILSAEEILEVSFKKAKKIQIPDRDPVYRNKKTIIVRTESFTDSISARLEKYVKEFPFN